MGKEMEKGILLLEIWNEKLQAELIELSKLWGRYILVKFYNSSYKEYTGTNKELLMKIGLTFIHSLVHDSRDRFHFYGLEIQKIDCVGKFTEEEYKMLGETFHWAELPKY